MITTKVMSCVRGQTLPLVFTCRDYKGQLVNLTGAACYLTVRTDELAAVAVVALTTGSGIVLADQTGAQMGQFTATIPPTATLPLEVGDYVWDAWVVTAAGDKFPVIATSIFTLLHEITRPS